MADRLPAPTEEELAEAEARIERKRAEEQFEENRRALESKRPRGAARLSSARSFRATEPPLNRGPMEYEPPADDPEDGQTPADRLRAVNNGTTKPAPAPKPAKKSRFDVPDNKTPSTILKALGVLYVEERKKNPVDAFQNLRDSIMINLDLLLPAMPQIKQMFELLQIGEPEKQKETNGRGKDIGELTAGLRSFLQGDDNV